MWHRGILKIGIYIFRGMILLMFLSALTILSTPLLGINELFYPVRIDSVSIVYSSQKLINDTLAPGIPMFNPSQSGMKYQELQIFGKDSIPLVGWEIFPEGEINQLILLLIHDINESRLHYIRFSSLIASQGVRVFMFDQRAHGVSGGDYFSYGMTGVSDIINMVDAIKNQYPNHALALYGNGAGAALALQFCKHDKRADMVLINNGFTSLQEHFQQFAYAKWGKVSYYIYPVLQRQLEAQTGFEVNSLHLDSLIAELTKPVLISSDTGNSYRLNQAVKLFLAANNTPENKFALLDFSKELNDTQISFNALKQMMTFLNSSLQRMKSIPKKNQKKLAFQ